MEQPASFLWSGAQEAFLNEPSVAFCHDVVIGCYGGRTGAGAHKNEDAALVWRHPEEGWTFAAILDAHAGVESVEAVLGLVESRKPELLNVLAQPVETAFGGVQKTLLDALSSPAFKETCRRMAGETALLACVQKGGFVWWLSVGDCVLYLLHPDLMKLGQYALNQRQFFEWVGRVNTFVLPAPAYTTGVRELRRGLNHLMLVTDGLLEFGARPFEEARALADIVLDHDAEEAVATLLARIHEGGGRDSPRDHHSLEV